MSQDSPAPAESAVVGASQEPRAGGSAVSTGSSASSGADLCFTICNTCSILCLHQYSSQGPSPEIRQISNVVNYLGNILDVL